MTTTRSSSATYIVILMLLVVLDVLMLKVPIYVPSYHAPVVHGLSDVEKIHNCINGGKHLMFFRDNLERNKYYVVCRLPDGRMGLSILFRKLNEWKEKTAFVPSRGLQYVCDIATQVLSLPK